MSYPGSSAFKVSRCPCFHIHKAQNICYRQIEICFHLADNNQCSYYQAEIKARFTMGGCARLKLINSSLTASVDGPTGLFNKAQFDVRLFFCIVAQKICMVWRNSKDETGLEWGHCSTKWIRSHLEVGLRKEWVINLMSWSNKGKYENRKLTSES